MAIQHLVWLKQKEKASKEEIELLLSQIRELGKLNGVLSITAGSNFTDRANGFTHAVTVTLRDKDALEYYLTSPEHQALGGKIRQLCELMALDYEDTA